MFEFDQFIYKRFIEPTLHNSDQSKVKQNSDQTQLTYQIKKLEMKKQSLEQISSDQNKRHIFDINKTIITFFSE